MPTLNNNSPAFDYTELVAELDLPFTKYQPVEPLQTGSHVHNLDLKKENINPQPIFKTAASHSSVVYRQLSGKPLVISFYTAHWQQYGLQHLVQLDQLQREIKALGANLLIVTPDEIDKTLAEMIWDNSLNLNFYHDQDNEVAKKFRIFSDANPAWNRYPGIEVNIPLLATYILDTTNQVIFDHVDHQLGELFHPAQLLNALHQSSLFQFKSKSA